MCFCVCVCLQFVIAFIMVACSLGVSFVWPTFALFLAFRKNEIYFTLVVFVLIEEKWKSPTEAYETVLYDLNSMQKISEGFVYKIHVLFFSTSFCRCISDSKEK